MTLLKKTNTKSEIVNICRLLHQKNMLAAADGNISYRINNDEILITPSGVAKAFMNEEEMAIINLDGKIIKGNPSSERLMHLEVYKSSEDAKAVVHAHPPHSIAWTIAFPQLEYLPLEAMSELILACGSVPIIPFALPGSEQMGEFLKPHLPKNKVMILARHGALTWGNNLEEAYRGMERLEHACQILTIAQGLGGVTSLSEDKVFKLRALREEIEKKMGNIIL
jgi:L-fuculose-phosphate aldolase